MRKPMTLDDYMASRWVAEPLRLFDCCPSTDGGGACIVTSLERARDLAKRPARILGAGQSHASEIIHPTGRDPQHIGGTRRREMVFGMAGVTPKDIDVAQFYDAFTPRVIHDLVAYGFCAPAEVGDFVAAGTLDFGGALPCEHRRRPDLGRPSLGLRPHPRSRAPAARRMPANAR